MQGIQFYIQKSEIGAGTRGASLGPDALKIAALNKRVDLFQRYQTKEIPNQNHLLWADNRTPTAIRIEGILEVYNATSNAIKTALENGEFPVLLSGDHASAGGTIAGVKAAFPDKRIGVVWIDAHGDLHSPYTSPTGNIHGMPLATALAEDNLPCKQKEISEKAKESWEKLKNIQGIAPKIYSTDLVFFGVRDVESPEISLIKSKSIPNYTVEECRKNGIQHMVNQCLDHLQNCDLIYLSFDVDSMDSEEVSSGTGTPVPNGFLPSEVIEIIKGIIESKKVCCFELVEINPTLDNKKNKMAETALEVLNRTVSAIEKISI